MLGQYDCDNMTLAARDRHAEMLADSMRRRLVKEALGDQEPKRSAWDWFCETILHRLPHEHALKPAARHHFMHG